MYHQNKHQPDKILTSIPAVKAYCWNDKDEICEVKKKKLFMFGTMFMFAHIYSTYQHTYQVVHFNPATVKTQSNT